jgi:glycosyltransferase involved in cell wall biosynthesis
LDRTVARSLGQEKPLAVYTYEDGALETFRRAEALGMRRFYDLPIGYWRAWRRILAQEQEREPEWAETLQGARDSATKLERKDEELRLANDILVASTFTRNTLNEAPRLQGEIHIIPYGSPPVVAASGGERYTGKLRILFVGALSQRKGLSYLVKAVALLRGRVELTLIGAKPAGRCVPLDAALREHRWIPSLPHERILAEMRRHDVLVFPSLFEGFGLVILEAMSQGLPVITTPHTAGPDLIQDGRDGFIVPIRSAETIAQPLDMLASDRGFLADMSEAARQTAASFTWQAYRDTLVSIIGKSVKPAPPAPAALAR